MPDQPAGLIVHLLAESSGQRLDVFVAEALPDLSRSEVQRQIKAGRVLVNDMRSKPAHRLDAGDRVLVFRSASEPPAIAPEDIPLDILYEDNDLVVIDKPAGMVVHPAHGNMSGTLVNAALARWPQMQDVGGSERAGVVHRLDKPTSGVLVLAKTSKACEVLQMQFKERTVYKCYIALVEGSLDAHAGIIDAPVGRDPRRRKRMAVVHTGRQALTRYRLVEDLSPYALLEVEPQTGRTHQIRVHLAWLGHPIVGDRVYGYRKQSIKLKKHIFLHAAEIHFDSPTTGERLRFVALLPAALEDILTKLRQGKG